MDTATEVALIGGLCTLGAAALALVPNIYLRRIDRQRVQQDLNRWTLELDNRRQIALHKVRLRIYPEVLSALAELSHHRIHHLTPEKAAELADRLNEWGYGEPGLCMLPDTRETLFELRGALMAYSQNRLSTHDLVSGPRTDLIEKLRRDVSQPPSLWRRYKTTIEISSERDRKLLSMGDARKVRNGKGMS